MPRRDGPLGIDAAVVAAGRLLRELQNASAKVISPDDTQWNLDLTEPAAFAWRQHSPIVVCHNDAAVFNLVVYRRRPRALIDWDFAAPAPRIWDLTSMARRSLAPLLPERARRALGWPDDQEVGRGCLSTPTETLRASALRSSMRPSPARSPTCATVAVLWLPATLPGS